MPIENLNIELSEVAENEFKTLIPEMENWCPDNDMDCNSRNGVATGLGNFLPLDRDPGVDRLLRLQLRNRNKEHDKSRELLPVYKMKKEILEKIQANKVVVIKGQAGCGKSTQIPQYILNSYISDNKGSLCKILCTQPRRISVIGVAERVAKERDESWGESSSVGYQIRLDSKLPRENGSIVYCTTGVLFHWLHKDHRLSGYSHVILDEVHERNLETDVLIVMLRELLKSRTDLKLVLMSATMEEDLFSQYFDNCPVINVTGFCYPVEKVMLEDIVELTGFDCKGNGTPPSYMRCFVETIREKYSTNTLKVLRNWDEERINFDLLVALLRHICFKEDKGAVLIFLPGWEDISTLHCLLMEDAMFNTPSFCIMLLHSQIPVENQRKVFLNPPEGVRKIVISTDIAETSVTIEDVVYVVDCGMAKITNFNIKRNTVTLNLCWIANSNAEQRRGRAGRVRPGKCYHLFTSHREKSLEDYKAPEILRAKLMNICLKIKALKFGDIRELLSKAMDKPAPQNVKMSIELLKTLNALDENENLTPLGSILAQLPLDPRLGKMIIFGAIFSCLNPILTIAAALEYKSPFYAPRNQKKAENIVKTRLSANSQSDHIAVVRAFHLWTQTDHKSKFCAENFLVESTMDMLKKLRLQFVNDLYNLGFLAKNNPSHSSTNENSNNVELVKGIICAGLYPSVAIKLDDGYFTIENGRVFLHPQSLQQRKKTFQHKWMVYFNKMRTTKVYLFDVTVVSDNLLFLFGGSIKNDTMMMDEWIRIRTQSAEKYTLLRNIRERLDGVVNNIIEQRRVLNWDNVDTEVKFLHAIVHLASAKKDDEIKLASNNVVEKTSTSCKSQSSRLAAALSSTCLETSCTE